MNLSSPVRAFLPFALLLIAVAPLRAQYTNGQNASLVLGQSDFTNNTPNNGGGATPSQSSLSGTRGVAVDSATGKLYVADTANNRVLRYSSVAALSSGAAAELVLGQPDFITTTASNSDTGMNTPSGVTMDSSGVLWVADTGNNRVLQFKDASLYTVNGEFADGVLGQPDFDVSSPATTQSGMSAPSGVAVNSSGVLFVADFSNNRVLRFDNAAARDFGAPADAVFGQSNFLSAVIVTPPTAASLNQPWNLGLDANGNLWVADSANQRVLCFTSPASLTNGANASVVLGQTTFDTNTVGTSSSQFTIPIGITFDNSNRLYVSEYGNNRVMVFGVASTLTNGASASFVLGQTDFDTGTSGSSQFKLNQPWGLSYYGGYLRVADSANNRVLSFTIIPGTPVINSSPSQPKLYVGKSRTYKLFLTSNAASDSYTLKSNISKTVSKKIKSISFNYAGANITSAVKAGTYVTSLIPQGQRIQIDVKITPRNNAKGTVNVNYVATSKTLSTSTDSQSVAAKIQKK